MEKEERTKKEYFSIIEKCSDIFKSKLIEYGTSWRVFRLPAMVDQIFIKIKRIRQIEETQKNNVGDDPLNDYMAIINYCLIGLTQLKLNSVTQPDLDDLEATSYYNHNISNAWALLEKKNADYGEAWRAMEIKSFTDLMLAKILRIKQLAIIKGEIKSEGIDSNYYDIMNYAIFALIKITTELPKID